MKFIYMDESGKSFLNHNLQQRFLIGALIINREDVPQALETFKSISKNIRSVIKQGIHQNPSIKALPQDERNVRIGDIMEKFEIHTNELFHPYIDKTKRVKAKDQKQGKKNSKKVVYEEIVIKENPWKYINEDDALRLVSEIFVKLAPSINSIYMFQVERGSYLSHFSPQKPDFSHALREMVKFISKDFHNLSQAEQCNITIVTDTIDSRCRDWFIEDINLNSYDKMWIEPILVESYKNAFIQLIDLITYTYYLGYSDQLNEEKEKHGKGFIKFKSAYKKHIKDLIVDKDLIDNLHYVTPLDSTIDETPGSKGVNPVAAIPPPHVTNRKNTSSEINNND